VGKLKKDNGGKGGVHQNGITELHTSRLGREKRAGSRGGLRYVKEHGVSAIGEGAIKEKGRSPSKRREQDEPKNGRGGTTMVSIWLGSYVRGGTTETLSKHESRGPTHSERENLKNAEEQEKGESSIVHQGVGCEGEQSRGKNATLRIPQGGRSGWWGGLKEITLGGKGPGERGKQVLVVEPDNGGMLTPKIPNLDAEGGPWISTQTTNGL